MVVDRIHAFISYATSDATAVRDELCFFLAGHAPHIEAWYDEQQPAGYAFRPVLEHRIATTDVMLFVLTEGATASTWCRWEAELARVRAIPVLVLRVHETDPMPDLFERLSIDVLNRGEDAWTELLSRLNDMASPAALVESYQKRLDVLQRRAATLPPEARRRYDEQFNDLRERQLLQGARLTERSMATGLWRSPQRAEVDLQSGVADLREAILAPSRAAPPPPPVTFCDRIAETNQLAEATGDPQVRLLVLSGPSGGGKTAVVSRLARRLDEAGSRLLYLAASGYQPVDPTAVLAALVEAVPDSNRAAVLRRSVAQGAHSVGERLDEVFDALEGEHVVLTLDDAEELLDATGEIESTPLRQLLDDLLERPGPVSVRLIVASTDPPTALLRRHPAERCKHISIRDGLDPGDAWDFLTSLDGDDLLGLSNATTTERERLWHLTQGWPRALELIIGLLTGDPELTLTDVMGAVDTAAAFSAPAPDAVVAYLLRQAVEQMDRTQQRAMHALAIYGRPVPPEAVDTLLEPYLPRIRTSALLSRLHHRRLVRREGTRYYLPRQPDGEQILALIPWGEVGDGLRELPPTTQVALFSRAAGYFADLPRPVGHASDLTVPFAEIELRLNAHEDETALDLMDELTRHYLAPAGNADTLNPWRRQLSGRLVDGYDAVHNLSQMANAHLAVGEPRQAILALNRASIIAENYPVPRDVLDLAVQMGDAHFDAGDIAQAATCYGQALRDAMTTNLPLLQAQAQVGLMQCGVEIADFSKALEHYDVGMKIVQRCAIDSDVIAPGPSEIRRTKALFLLHSALLEATLGRFSPALRAVREGNQIAESLKEARLVGAFLIAEAVIRIDLGELDLAGSLATKATQVGLQMRNPQLSREAGATLARALLCNGNVEAAEQAARQAARSFQDPRSMGALALHGLTLLRLGETRAAHQAFSRAEAHGRGMIALDRRSYDIQDHQGLVTVGLVLCGDSFRLEDALACYRAARNTTREERVVRRSVRLLRQLAADADPALRDRVVAVAAGPLRDAI